MRFGLLGTGPWADRAHAPALAAHAGVEFAGVWGRRPEAAKELTDRFGGTVFTDADELFAACDAVAFALPPDVQAPLAVRAARAGCHLLLDKPVDLDADGSRAVAEAADEAGVASVVFFTLRFGPVTSDWVADRIAEGDAMVGRADWFSPVFAGGDTPYADSPWRRAKGALWDVGPHALSVLLPVLGDVRELHAARGHDGTTHLILRHAEGASSTVTVSMTMPPAGSGVIAELRGPSGVFTLPDREVEAKVALGSAIDALLEAARTGTPHACDAWFGHRVTQLLADAESQLGTAGAA